MDIIGNKYGKLTVISIGKSIRLPCGQTNKTYECECDCGNNNNVRKVHLVRNRTLSCGCNTKTRNGEGSTLLCKVWRGIKQRCLENYCESHLYFKKGISVCIEWQNSYELFKEWSLNNGYKKGLQIDRIDNSKGYCPENCRWVSSLINSNNRDNNIVIEYNGEKKPLSLILFEIGKKNHYSAIYRRIQRGWNPQKAIDTPIRKGNYYKNNV